METDHSNKVWGDGGSWTMKQVQRTHNCSLWNSIRAGWDRFFSARCTSMWGLVIEWSFSMIGGVRINLWSSSTQIYTSLQLTKMLQYLYTWNVEQKGVRRIGMSSLIDILMIGKWDMMILCLEYYIVGLDRISWHLNGNGVFDARSYYIMFWAPREICFRGKEFCLPMILSKLLSVFDK